MIGLDNLFEALMLELLFAVLKMAPWLIQTALLIAIWRKVR